MSELSVAARMRMLAKGLFASGNKRAAVGLTDLIDELDKQGGWISVAEYGSPEDITTVDVLINSQRRVVDCLFIGGLFYVDKKAGESAAIKNNVTHWMVAPALPTPPKGN